MSETAQPIRVVLVDDQPLIRTGFSTILGTEPSISVVAEASNGAEAITAVAQHRPDVVCMDVQMPEMDGITATRKIVESGAESSILILTTFNRDEFLFEALQAGAAGFLLKTAGPEELITAVKTLAAGESLLAPEVTRRVLERFVTQNDDGAAPKGSGSEATAATPARPAVLNDLTRREEEILHLVAAGKSNGEIAEELFVGAATVKTHVSNLLMKLGVTDRLHAVIWAYENGVVGK